MQFGSGRGASPESADGKLQPWLVLGSLQSHMPPPGPHCNSQPKGPQRDSFIAVNGRQFPGLRNTLVLASVEQNDSFHTLTMLFQTETSFVMVSGMMRSPHLTPRSPTPHRPACVHPTTRQMEKLLLQVTSTILFHKEEGRGPLHRNTG